MKKINITVSPELEALKEPLRLALLAAVSTFITFLLEGIVKLPMTTTIFVLTLILRTIDKYLHEKAKITRKEGIFGLTGLTGF